MPKSVIDIKNAVPYFLASICFFSLQSCSISKNYYALPSFAGEGSINCVVEISAGTNKKYEYNNTSKAFLIDKENGQGRIIDFLPYPANYGYIPSTLSKNENGGDGDALDVLVISEALPTGTVVESVPIAVLKLIDDGETDYKVIAVPFEKSIRVISATTYSELSSNYPALLKILELWFLNYNKNDVSTIEGWGNEQEATSEIKHHLNTKY